MRTVVQVQLGTVPDVAGQDDLKVSVSPTLNADIA